MEQPEVYSVECISAKMAKLQNPEGDLSLSILTAIFQVNLG